MGQTKRNYAGKQVHNYYTHQYTHKGKANKGTTETHATHTQDTVSKGKETNRM